MTRAPEANREGEHRLDVALAAADHDRDTHRILPPADTMEPVVRRPE